MQHSSPIWMPLKSVFSSMTTGLQSKLSFGHVLIIPIVSQIHYVQTLTEYS